MYLSSRLIERGKKGERASSISIPQVLDHCDHSSAKPKEDSVEHSLCEDETELHELLPGSNLICFQGA